MEFSKSLLWPSKKAIPMQ